ncbi:MAG TPA: RIP metalloprotease RseP [Thermoanaerobaculia bacterium]|nr:RIP metalloprotease RseP [Thermoanaerobaculia bacterium]
MDFLVNTVAFIFALGVIIFVHEAGHYLVAKAFDVRVLTFSLGFGRKIYAFQRGETEYRVSWIPLGGYVRLGGENPEEATGDARDFQSKPRWQRILVFLAGPLMNVVLAVGLTAVVFAVGLEVPYLLQVPPVVGAVEPGSPAAAAGLQPGDRVLTVRGEPVGSWEPVQMAIMESPDKPLRLRIARGEEERDVVVTPVPVAKYEFGDAGMFPSVLPRVSMVVGGSPAERAGFQPGDEIREVDGRPLLTPAEFVRYIEQHPGEEVVVEVLREDRLVPLPVVPEEQGGVGRIGVGLTISQQFGPVAAVVESFRYNWNVARQTVVLVGKLVSREMKPQTALHGPIEIAALSGEAARQGLPSLLHLMGLVSISIAILNLLPIPVLDGGQILILLIESGIRRDLSLRLKEAVNLVGLAFIVLLMVAVIFFDLRRNLPFAQESAAPAPAEAPAAPEP